MDLDEALAEARDWRGADPVKDALADAIGRVMALCSRRELAGEQQRHGWEISPSEILAALDGRDV
jgi:hypothetical protein